ncbi:MAG: hypothetical protein GYB20_13040 [Oceanospirillales bacterium]|nr:hypothetical protein [Oceanospirillales bacterium]MBR9888602.1 hypothetical protein [Oceanospirillales bacterium]
MFVTKVSKVEMTLWISGLSVFIISRLFKQEFLGEGFLFGLIFLVLGFWWFVVPFATGKEISLPSYADTDFIKGKDDLMRWAFLLLGIFMFVVSLSVQ